MSTQGKDASTGKNIAAKNIVLIILVIAIAVIPFFLQKKAGFAGADDRATYAITQIKPDYKPWFNSLWTPPSSEIESLIFAVQAGIGCLVIGYYIGYVRGRKKKEDTEKS